MLEKIKKVFQRNSLANIFPPYQHKKPVWNDYNAKASYEFGYKRNTYVYACINAISKACNAVEWYVEVNGKRVDNHALTHLINNPSAFHSRKDLIERTVQSLYLTGNSFFYKIRDNKGHVIELWHVPTENVTVIADKETFIECYMYEQAGIKTRIEPKDMMHDLFINPENAYIGMSPLKTGGRIIDTDNEALEWNRYAMQNRAMTDGAFIFDQVMTKQQFEQARELIKQQYTNRENSRAPWVLGNAAKWQAMNMNAIEMDFVNSRKMTREEICSLFQVPPPIISIYDNATLANIETARKIFWLDTVIPLLEDIQQTLNSSLSREYGNETKIVYDTSNVEALQPLFRERLMNAKMLSELRVPFKEINERLKLGFTGETEKPDPSIFATEPNANEQEPKSENGPFPPKSEDENKGFFIGNISEKKSVSSHDRNFWEELEQQKFKYDVSLTSAMRKIFDDMAKEVPNAYKHGGEEMALSKIEEYESEMKAVLIEHYTNVFNDIGQREYDHLINRFKTMPQYEVKHEQKLFSIWQVIFASTFMQWIQTTCADRVTNVSDTTKKRIKKLFKDMHEEFLTDNRAPSLDNIAKELKKKFKDFSRYRAYMIARTETASATNSARYQAQQLAQQQIQEGTGKGVEIKRRWLTAKDERVRKSHQFMDGQTVDLDGKFTFKSGKKIAFPSEYERGLPSETINCRCDTVSVIYIDGKEV